MAKYRIKQVRMIPHVREVEVEAVDREHACEIAEETIGINHYEALELANVLDISAWHSKAKMSCGDFRHEHNGMPYEDGCNSNADDAVVLIRPPRPAKTIQINGETLTSLKTKVLLTRGFEDPHNDIFDEMQKRRTNRERTVYKGTSGYYYVNVLNGWWSIARWDPSKISNRAWLASRFPKPKHQPRKKKNV